MSLVIITVVFATPLTTGTVAIKSSPKYNSTLPMFIMVPSFVLTFTVTSTLSPLSATMSSTSTVVSLVITNNTTFSLSTDAEMIFNPLGTV